MNATVEQLASGTGFPRISIYFPTHPTFPDWEQDPIRLSNCLKRATTELEEAGIHVRTLLIETEARETVEKAIETIARPDVVPDARISLFCGLERAKEYSNNPALQKIHSYTKEALRHDLRVLWPFIRSKPDVVVAIFSGRRIFLKQKMLFWLLPARARLAFNENNDCAYVTRWHALRLLRIQSPTISVDPLAGSRFVPLLLKGVLLLPRFAYLLIWFTLMKLLRAYRLEQIAKYTSRPGP